MNQLRPASPVQIVDFASVSPELSVGSPAAERLLAGTPEHKTRNFFSDATGQFFAGTWESTAGKWRVRYAETEFCHIVRGEVAIESETGDVRVFGAGDSFVIPAGFVGTWDVRIPTLKLYVIFEPASS